MAVSDADIQAYVQANIGNPAAIAAAAEQYGVSLDDLSRATGYDSGTINNYFSQANVTPYYQEPAPAPEPISYTPVEPPPEPISYAPPAPVEPTPVYPEPETEQPIYNFRRGGGRVLEDTNDFGSNVGNFGELDYFSSSPQPQTRVDATPPPAPIPEALSLPPEQPPAPQPPPQPMYTAPVAPAAPVAPTVTPVAQPKSLVDQILAQGTTSKWTGEGFGSAEKNAADMAKILSDIGITDISQFGKITKEEPVYSYDENGNQTQTGTQTVETFGNKLTGQTVGNTYGERQTGDAFGGTYAGKGNTGYRVQFDEKGNPYFYTSGQSSSDAGSWMPIVQLALAATGAGGLLGNALLGAGAGAVATNALGNAIISGALTGAQGGDVLKGALLGGAGGAIGGYFQGAGSATPGAGDSLFGGAIDGSTVNFADLAETGVIDSLKAQGLSNAQISQFLENASAADLGWTPPVDAIPGAGIDFSDLADNSIIDSLKAQGLSNTQISDFLNNSGGTGAVAPVTPGIETVNVTGTAAPAVTAPVVPTMIDPNVLAAVTTQLNSNIGTPVPEVKITSDKVTKTDDVTTPAVAPVVPVVPTVPTVEVVGDKVVKPKDETVPTVEVVGDKPVKPVVPTVEVVGDKVVKPKDDTIPTVEIVADKPVKPVVPEVVITAPPTPPVTPPPVVPEVVITAPPTPPVPPPVPPVTPPTVIVPPVVLPPPKPPQPPVVVPPPPPLPPVTNGLGLNPGLIETTPFYNTTNDAQSKYFWGDRGFQSGPAFDAASYNAVAAPETPFGIQGVAAPLSAKDYEDIVAGRYTPEQFTPATRVQAYNPALLQTPVGQVNVSSGNTAVAGPVAPTTRYDMTNAEVQQVSSVLGPVLAQSLAIAMANGDQATINAIKSQYEYALMSQQNQGGG